MRCYNGVMSISTSLRVVVDTNVVFEGLTYQGNAAGLIVEAWLANLFQPCVSNALAYEYVDVLSRKLSPDRWQKLQPVLGKLPKGGRKAPNFSYGDERCRGFSSLRTMQRL
jgi:PIN domain